MQFIDLHRQFDRIEDGVREGFDAVLKHKGFIGGPEIKELQKQLAEYTDVKHVIACASGTDALTVPLKAWDLKETDAVFVPSFTFFASAESITLAGGTPVFVDVDYDTFNMDPADLEAKVKETLEEGKLTPKGIVAVDLFGLPADFPAIRKVADKYGLFVLEDAAQGFGGTIGDKRAGSFGDVGSTSFFPAKPLGCYGDGGAIFTSDDDMAFLIDSIHVHGKGTDKYDNVRIGYNSRLDTFQAVVLLNKMTLFDDELDKRNLVAAEYTKRLKDTFETPVVPEGYGSSWAQYTLKAKDKEERDMIVAKMKEQGIPVMVYYPIPIHRSGAYKHLGAKNLPVTDDLSDRVFSIPMHPYLELEEIEMICNALKGIVNR